MKAAKVDANQGEIVQALRGIGCSVQPLHTVGKGCPDLLVGFKGLNVALEVKQGEAKRNDLTPDQVKWHDNWRGQVAVVCSVEEATGLMWKLVGDCR